MDYSNNYNTKNYNKIEKNIKSENLHSANIELAERIKFEIEHFFDEDNKVKYLEHFTEEEATKYRTLSFGRKNAALTTVLAEVLGMSEKTFYHMANGHNSQFDKIVGVLDFFGLSFRYDIFLNEEKTIQNKQNILFRENDGNLSELENEVITKILTLDNDSLLAILPTINQLAKVSTSKTKGKSKKVLYKNNK